MAFFFFFYTYDAETQRSEMVEITDPKSMLKYFEGFGVRAAWDPEQEEWYFSVVDICHILSGSDNPRRYWSDLKRKLESEGSQLYDDIVQLKLPSTDGKTRMTDVATTAQVLRLIQSIPSPKAEPFKVWLAEVGKERLDEIADPEKAIDRALRTYRQKGYSEAWINQRLKSIEFRKELTDEWKRSGVKDGEYAILTSILTKAWSGMTPKKYKEHKSLTKENLRDNMTNTELVLNMLAEVSTTEISHATNPEGFKESAGVAKQGGDIARNARLELEQKIGRPVISSGSAKDMKLLDE